MGWFQLHFMAGKQMKASLPCIRFAVRIIPYREAQSIIF
jgi:hypothetical protein